MKEVPLTSYSVLPSGNKAKIIATWTSERSDHSASITTLADADEAATLAYLLTRLSEHAWDAAAWLDTSPAIESAIQVLAERLRAARETITPVEIRDSGCRHASGWAFEDFGRLLRNHLPEVLTKLTQAQRFSVADELAHDAAERAEALRLLPTGWDPESADSRVWQMCEVTRSQSFGETGWLPEGGSGWINRVWSTQNSPARRWGARDRLVRLEQLIAAAKMYGGRGDVEENPTHAHVVVPKGPNSQPSAPEVIVKVFVHDGTWDEEDADPFAPLIIVTYENRAEPQRLKVQPEDDEAFARILGEWTGLVPCPVTVNLED